MASATPTPTTPTHVYVQPTITAQIASSRSIPIRAHLIHVSTAVHVWSLRQSRTDATTFATAAVDGPDNFVNHAELLTWPIR